MEETIISSFFFEEFILLYKYNNVNKSNTTLFNRTFKKLMNSKKLFRVKVYTIEAKGLSR